MAPGGHETTLGLLQRLATRLKRARAASGGPVKRTLLALHGVPTSPRLWDPLARKLERSGSGWRVEAPALKGLLLEQVAAVVPLLTPDTVVVGHDMGGVVAAMAALEAPPRAVVLTGTALGPWWALIRASAWPVLWRPFYRRHGGRHFVAAAGASARREAALAAFPGADPLEMRAIARSMRPPARLAPRLAAVAPVFLLWGEADRWYPAPVAHALARAAGTRVRLLPGGHFAPWEEPEAYATALEDVLRTLP